MSYLHEIRDSLIAQLTAAGLDVYMMPPVVGNGEPLSNCYATFTDGERIGYVQWSGGIIRWSTCHIPNRTTGTGFCVDSMDEALSFCPNGVRQSDRASVRKWPNWETYWNRDRFSRQYVLVAEGRK